MAKAWETGLIVTNNLPTYVRINYSLVITERDGFWVVWPSPWLQ
jgi:hypothetical protein